VSHQNIQAIQFMVDLGLVECLVNQRGEESYRLIQNPPDKLYTGANPPILFRWTKSPKLDSARLLSLALAVCQALNGETVPTWTKDKMILSYYQNAIEGQLPPWIEIQTGLN
jgi:hypothetical protein